MPERLKSSNPPLTDEQIEFFTEQTEKAAEKAGYRAAVDVGRHITRRATVGFLILLAGLFYVRHEDSKHADEQTAARVQSAQDSRKAVVESGRVISVDGCNRDFRDRVEVRAVLIASKRIQKAEFKKGNISRERYKLATRFYDERLKGLPLPDCREAAKVLTDDPNKVPEVPNPLYPGGPGTENLKGAG